MIPTHERMVDAATVSSISGMFRRAEQGPYTIPELHRYVGFSGGPHTSVNLPIEAKNVILLIVESLSSMDSAKISGIENRLPNFDRISADGIIFNHFMANYSDTEGGIVGLPRSRIRAVVGRFINPFGPRGRSPLLWENGDIILSF